MAYRTRGLYDRISLQGLKTPQFPNEVLQVGIYNAELASKEQVNFILGLNKPIKHLENKNTVGSLKPEDKTFADYYEGQPVVYDGY